MAKRCAAAAACLALIGLGAGALDAAWHAAAPSAMPGEHVALAERPGEAAPLPTSGYCQTLKCTTLLPATAILVQPVRSHAHSYEAASQLPPIGRHAAEDPPPPRVRA